MDGDSRPRSGAEAGCRRVGDLYCNRVMHKETGLHRVISVLLKSVSGVK